MSSGRLEELAAQLGEAWDRGVAVAAPTATDPTLTSDDAYTIQEMIIDARSRDSRGRAGWKMGLTSADPPTTPIVGTLLSDMVVRSGVDLALGSLVAPMVEAEIVVRIGETIDRHVNVEDLRAGPHEIGPGLEVIDYRTTSSSGVVDWIADNSTVAYAVVGELSPIAGTDPADIAATLSGPAGVLASGVGSQVMGNPLQAVAWLTGHLAGRGQSAGERSRGAPWFPHRPPSCRVGRKQPVHREFRLLGYCHRWLPSLNAGRDEGSC